MLVGIPTTWVSTTRRWCHPILLGGRRFGLYAAFVALVAVAVYRGAWRGAPANRASFVWGHKKFGLYEMLGKKQVITKGKRMSMSHVHIMKHSCRCEKRHQTFKPSFGMLGQKAGSGEHAASCPMWLSYALISWCRFFQWSFDNMWHDEGPLEYAHLTTLSTMVSLIFGFFWKVQGWNCVSCHSEAEVFPINFILIASISSRDIIGKFPMCCITSCRCRSSGTVHAEEHKDDPDEARLWLMDMCYRPFGTSWLICFAGTHYRVRSIFTIMM